MSSSSKSTDPELLFAQTDWLRSLARSIVQDADAAEDVVQDTLVAALEHGPREDRRGLRAWLATVAANFARRRDRANSVRRYHETIAAERRHDESIAADELELVRLQQLLTSKVLELSEPHRSALVLRFHQGLSYRTLSKRLGITTATARKRVSRGISLLRASVERARAGKRECWALCMVFADKSLGSAAPLTLVGGITMSAKSTWISLAALAALCTAWFVARETPRAPALETNSEAETVQLELPTLGETDMLNVERHIAVSAPISTSQVPEDAEQAVSPLNLLRGRAVNASGDPIANAEIEIRRDRLREFDVLDLKHAAKGQAFGITTSDAEGFFNFEVDQGKAYDLIASRDGLARTLHANARAGQFVTLTLNEAASFTGRVLRPDGSLVTSALVRGRWLESRLPAFEGRTDEEGRFRFGDLEEGRVRVQIVPRRDASLWGREVHLVPGQRSERDFVVQTGYLITGYVTDSTTGAPIEGAVVGEGWTYTKSVTTDKDGHYRLVGFTDVGVHEIHAHAPGYGGTSHDLPRSGRTREMNFDFALQPSISARGRLVDSRGRAIARAYVAAAASTTYWSSGRTDDDGLFRLDQLDPNVPYCLFAVARGFGTCAIEFPRPILDKGEYDLKTITLYPGAILSGRIVDKNGRPLQNVDIHLQAQSYDQRFALSGPLSETIADSYVNDREGRTDDQGHFAFGDLAPGEYVIGAGPSGQTSSFSEPIRIEAGTEVSDIEVFLDAGLEILGRVVDERGEPLPGIVVSIFPEPPCEGRIAQILTGPDGTFRADGFALGTYRISVASTQLRDDHETRPFESQELSGVDPFGGALNIVLEPAR